MKDIKIEILPALSGDSFIVSVNADIITNILIDAGYGETYEDYLKDRLEEIRSSGHSINLMVITHIDSDHISGAIKFLEANNSAINSKEFVQIDEIWHNALRHLYVDDSRVEEVVEKNDRLILEYLQMKGMPIPSDSRERRNRKISAVQGSILGALIKNGFYNWNSKAKEKAICVNNVEEPCYINNVKIFLISPDLDRIDGLKEKWEKSLKENKKFKGKITKDVIFDDVFEILLGESFDKSIRKRHKLISGNLDLADYLDDDDLDEDAVNCSSISFILEYQEKKVLFLGDSNPDDVFDKIKKLYDWDEKNRIFFDAIKISHHGSKGNTTSKLLSMIDSDKFIISTNGKGGYNHPDYETIAKIVCRDTKYTRELIFNYESIAEKFNNEEWMKTYKYKIKEVNDGKIQEIYI